MSEAIKILKPMHLLNIIEAYKMDQALIFCRTKLDCDNLEYYLITLGGGKKYKGKVEKGVENPYSCVVLHADRPMNERKANLQAFKEGEIRFLICTDVAARGIDITGLPYVINMTLPDKSEDYIHRIGRVGRVDRMGLAISLIATEKEKVWYHQCPSKGKNCKNTNLVDQGGCAIWYDEPELLRLIEERLKHKIAELGANYQYGDSGKVIYGEGRSNVSAETAIHVEALRPQVKALTELEVKAQLSYLNLKTKYLPKKGKKTQ